MINFYIFTFLFYFLIIINSYMCENLSRLIDKITLPFTIRFSCEKENLYKINLYIHSLEFCKFVLHMLYPICVFHNF